MANSSESKHEENSGPVPQQFFQPLPREVIRYWLEGNYTGGIAPSVAYDQLGWALMFRGFYRYQLSAPKAQNSHRGYCVIDLQNGEICCYGVRLFSASSQWKEIADYFHPFLWKSEAGTIRAGRSSARLSCALRTLATRRWQASSPPPDLLTLGSEAEKPGEQAIAVSYIADRFERDWQEISNKFKEEEDSKEILGGFMVRAELPAADGLVKLKGASSTFHDSGVYAEVELTRIDNAIS